LIGIDCYADERLPQRLVVQYDGGGMIEKWNCEQETVVATDNYQSPYDEWTGA
jgi:hypothetical protein